MIDFVYKSNGVRCVLWTGGLCMRCFVWLGTLFTFVSCDRCELVVPGNKRLEFCVP